MIFFFIQSNSSKQLDCFRVKEEDMDELRMQFMGTGAGEGIPTPFCRCRICEHARKTGGKDVRLRSSFRVSDEMMIDFGTDIFAECIRNHTDLFDLKYLLITHTHDDHFSPFNLFLKSLVSRTNGEKVHIYLNGDAYKLIEKYDALGFDDSEHFFTDTMKNDFEFHQLHFWKQERIGDYLVTPVKGEHKGHLEANSANYPIELPDGKKFLYALDTGFYGEETRSFLKDAALDYLIIESTFGSADRGNKPYSHLDLNSVFYLCDVLYQQGTLTDRTQVYLTHINQEQDFIHEEMVAECEKRKTPYKVTVAYDGLQMADYKK